MCSHLNIHQFIRKFPSRNHDLRFADNFPRHNLFEQRCGDCVWLVRRRRRKSECGSGKEPFDVVRVEARGARQSNVGDNNLTLFLFQVAWISLSLHITRFNWNLHWKLKCCFRWSLLFFYGKNNKSVLHANPVGPPFNHNIGRDLGWKTPNAVGIRRMGRPTMS